MRERRARGGGEGEKGEKDILRNEQIEREDGERVKGEGEEKEKESKKDRERGVRVREGGESEREKEREGERGGKIHIIRKR